MSHAMFCVLPVACHKCQQPQPPIELKLAQAKKLQLGWLSSAWRQSKNLSLACLGLKKF